MKKFNELIKDPLIGKYCFSEYYQHDDWCHIKSNKIFQELDAPRFHVNHRLYLNIGNYKGSKKMLEKSISLKPEEKAPKNKTETLPQNPTNKTKNSKWRLSTRNKNC